MKIHTKFFKLYKTSDVTLAAKIRFADARECTCAFAFPRLSAPLHLYQINYPIYFSNCSYNTDTYFLPCFYS